MKMMKNRLGIPFVLSLAVALSYTTEARSQLPTIELEGNVSGIFTDPLPSGATTNAASNPFTWGVGYQGSPPSKLTFTGQPFNEDVIPIPVYGSDNRNNRRVFPIGTLSYFNGEIVSGTGATSVRLDNTVGITNAVAKDIPNPLAGIPGAPLFLDIPLLDTQAGFGSRLTLENTPNTSNQVESSDFVRLPNEFEDVELPLLPLISIDPVLNELLNPLSIRPLAFGSVQGDGFSTTTEFNVFERGNTPVGTGTATADLLARLAPACEPITEKGAVQVNLNGPEISATFTPNFSLTLSQAADICGYDHFNWYQLITVDPYPLASNNNPSTPLTPPYVDPPLGGYAGYPAGLFDDNLPFYWDEQTSTGLGDTLQENTTGTNVSFFDRPQDSRIQPGEFIEFTTSLAGVFSGSNIWDNLFTFRWKTNYTGTSGGVSRRSVSPTESFEPGGTGGIFDLELDLNPEDLPEAVRRKMEEDGARNASLTIPASVPEPTSALGLLVFGALSSGFLRKKKSTKN